jgi:ABC-type nitrate/sulfonate/bicarbonate transport system substrate-binding protein
LYGKGRHLVIIVATGCVLAMALAVVAIASERRTQATPLSLGLSSVASDYAVPLVAQQLGFFAKQGVDMTLNDNAGANLVNAVASGQMDIAGHTMSTALQVGQQGKDAEIIWANEYYPGLAFVSSKEYPTVAALRTASPCRIAVFPASVSIWAGTLYKRTLGLKNCETVPVGSATLQTQGIVAGSYQASPLGYTQAVQATSDGRANMLIDPTSEKFKATYGRSTYAVNGVWALNSTLVSKREGMIGFLRAYMGSADWIHTHTDIQVAAVLQQRESYRLLSLDAVLGGLKSARGYIGVLAKSKVSPRPGSVSKEAWTRSLKEFNTYGLTGYDAASPANAWGERVNMSLYDEAFPHLVTVDAKHNTLSKLAAWKLGSASKWKTLYTPSKFWFDTLNVPSAKIATAKLRPGTVFWW